MFINSFIDKIACHFQHGKTPGVIELFFCTELSTVSRPGVRAALLASLLLLSALSAALAQDARLSGRELLEQADAGDPWAQLNLGAAYDNGMGGFPFDPVRAVGWYRRAAEAGLAEAQFNLAHCLATGNGVARDDVAALDWMLMAAGQGLASAQFLTGVMFNEGLGTAPDRERALYWLAQAADKGNRDAAALLQRLQAGTAAQ